MKTFIQKSIGPAFQFLVLMAIAPLASAYIGPGSGISVIGSLLALLATIGIALLAIVMFPFRRMMKKKRGMAADAEDSDDEETPELDAAVAAKEGSQTK